MMKKLKSRKSINSNDMPDETRDLNAYLKDKELQELHKKLSTLEEMISQYFEHILNTSIKEVTKIKNTVFIDKH